MFIAPTSNILKAICELPSNASLIAHSEWNLLVAKVLQLLQAMSEKHCCLDTIQFKDYQILKEIYNTMVEKAVTDCKPLPFKGGNLKAVVEGTPTYESDNQEHCSKVLQATSQFDRKQAIVSYLRIISLEFIRRPKSEVLKDLVLKIGSNGSFKLISASHHTLREEMTSMLSILQNMMVNFLCCPSQRDL